MLLVVGEIGLVVSYRPVWKGLHRSRNEYRSRLLISRKAAALAGVIFSSPVEQITQEGHEQSKQRGDDELRREGC